MSEFDKKYMEIALTVAAHSSCTKIKVGALVVKDGEILATGFNFPPLGKGCSSALLTDCPQTSNQSCLFALHAEVKVLFDIYSLGKNPQKGVLYTTLSPCLACAKCIYLAGIEQIVFFAQYSDYKGGVDEGLAFCSAVGVLWRRFVAAS